MTWQDIFDGEENMILRLVREQAVKKGFKNGYELWKALKGLSPGISSSVANNLYKGDFTMLRLETINLLCELLDCQPGDLLKYKKVIRVGSGK